MYYCDKNGLTCHQRLFEYVLKGLFRVKVADWGYWSVLVILLLLGELG